MYKILRDAIDNLVKLKIKRKHDLSEEKCNIIGRARGGRTRSRSLVDAGALRLYEAQQSGPNTIPVDKYI